MSVGAAAAARTTRAWTGALRAAALLVSLYTLMLARAGTSPVVLFALLAGSLAVLYAVERSVGGTVLPWAGYLGAFVVFAHLRTLADETGIAVKASYVLDAERALFGGALPSAWLQERLYEPGGAGLLGALCASVYVSYFVAPHLVALVLWRRTPELFRRYAPAILLAVYAGLALSFAVPTAPPWLAHEFAEAPDVARVLAEVLGWSPERYADGTTPGMNPVAAMPSLHVAVPVVMAAAAWCWRGLLRTLAIVYAVAMALVLVYTGEHYVLDVVAGALAGVLAWQLAGALVRRRA